MFELQQYLPLAVLKPWTTAHLPQHNHHVLQQYLPLAVLKHDYSLILQLYKMEVATVLTACGIETLFKEEKNNEQTNVATVLTACGIETG